MIALTPNLRASEQGITSIDAPDFSLTLIGGETVTLAELTGKVVLLNFWASWCGPCKEEIPHFNDVYVQYKDSGVYIIGVSVDRGENLVRRFTARREIRYPLAMATPQLIEDYQPGRVIPVTIFIDKKGKVRQKLVGYTDKETLEKYIKTMLEEN